MRRLGNQQHPPDALRLQQLRRELAVLPGGAAFPFLPAHVQAVVTLEGVGHDQRLAGRLAEMQATTGQQRQATGPGQARRIAQALQGHGGRLVATPGRVVALAATTEYDYRIHPLGQPRPLGLGQGRFGFERPGRPLHHHRQAHQPEAAEACDEAGQGQPGHASPQPPGEQEQQQEAAGR
ncbi:hypothetical protein D3C84_801320 [compost metagenome]